MQRLDGGLSDLLRRVQGHGRMCRRIARQFIELVGRLHGARVYHRDLHLGNVMYTERREFSRRDPRRYKLVLIDLERSSFMRQTKMREPSRQGDTRLEPVWMDSAAKRAQRTFLSKYDTVLKREMINWIMHRNTEYRARRRADAVMLSDAKDWCERSFFS